MHPVKSQKMKKNIMAVLMMGLSLAASAQLKAKPSCGTLVVDILNGSVNQVKPDFSVSEIKEKLPCFTDAQEESPKARCGGGVFFSNLDIYFYTQRDYVEIGEKFKGKLTIPLMGANRKNLFNWLGNPKIRDENWDAFEMAYGTLVLHYNAKGNVRLIQFSSKGTDALSLCNSTP